MVAITKVRLALHFMRKNMYGTLGNAFRLSVFALLSSYTGAGAYFGLVQLASKVDFSTAFLTAISLLAFALGAVGFVAFTLDWRSELAQLMRPGAAYRNEPTLEAFNAKMRRKRLVLTK